MTPRRAARGQPLLVLVLILSTWVGARFAIVTGADEAPAPPAVLAERVAPASIPSPALAPAAPTAQVAAEPVAGGSGRTGGERAGAVWPSPPPSAVIPAPLVRPPSGEAPLEPVARQGVPVRVAAGHQLLWMAAVSLLPSPQEATAFAAQQRRPMALAPAPAAPRWSADGWVLWRRGGAGTTGAGFAPSTYGASQAGAVVRYRLTPDSGHRRPMLYLRGTTALERPRGEEVAFGIAARPLAQVPITALVEARATRFAGGTKLRPAAALVTEISPFQLPARARGELYIQAGYVGGAGATGFVDGSLRVDRPLVALGKAELRAGGGVWGGAQKGATRLDLGPGVTLGVPLGDKASARVAADWRFRVAGSAAPASGPAVTLSAGF